jgi:hypothetical protein
MHVLACADPKKKPQEKSVNIFYSEFHPKRIIKVEIAGINPFARIRKVRHSQRRYLGTQNHTIKTVNIVSIRFVPNGTKWV